MEINSVSGGLTLPRMTTTQRDALGPDGRVQGTIIYNLDGDCIERFDGTNWNKVSEVTFGNILNVPADLLDGDDVNDADANPTNEIQDISTDGTSGNITCLLYTSPSPRDRG